MFQEIIGVIVVLVMAIFMAVMNQDAEPERRKTAVKTRTARPAAHVRFAPTVQVTTIDRIDQRLEKYN